VGNCFTGVTGCSENGAQKTNPRKLASCARPDSREPTLSLPKGQLSHAVPALKALSL
jgi:hypothetical protein